MELIPGLGSYIDCRWLGNKPDGKLPCRYFSTVLCLVHPVCYSRGPSSFKHFFVVVEKSPSFWC